jgi:gluconolactonase
MSPTRIEHRPRKPRMLAMAACWAMLGAFAPPPAATNPGTAAAPVESGVERLDPRLDALVARDAPVRRLASGFGFTEGPVWIPGTPGYLLFSDVPGNVIYKYDPQAGKAAPYLLNAGYVGPDIWRWGGLNSNGFPKDDPRHEEFPMIGPDGLGVDHQGRVLVTTFSGRSIVRLEADGTRTLIADRYEGRKLNGTNDIVVAHDGAIYFTDTYGGLRLRASDPRKELPYNALFRWKDGTLTLLISDMPNTNGLAFSPDETYLYANGGVDNYVRRYRVKPDGTLGAWTMFADFRGMAEPGVTDGMKVDTRGNVYVTGPGGIWIIDPDGRHLGTIRLPEHPINMAFGGADRRMLYVTAHTGLYAVPVRTPGL